MMREVGNVVMALCECGEQVKITCDADAWAVEHSGRVVYRAVDGRQIIAFLHGLARISGN